MTPAQLVQFQLEAYNARDLESFLTFYDDAVQVFRPPATAPSIVGKEQLAKLYAQRFSLASLHAELLNRIVVGNKVIDHERVFGVFERPFEIAVVYEVADGKIRTVWFFPGE